MNRYLTSALRGFGRLTWLAGLMLTASCASPPDPGRASAAPAEPLVHLVQRHQVCGAAVAVIRQGALHTISTGSGCEPALQVRRDSVFQAASLSKPVFAYAVLKLVQQGRLALDAPVLRYLPQGYRHHADPLQQGPEAKTDDVTEPRLRAVTVRMLLQHTAGLPNWASGPLQFEGTPGARWAYSGEGYVLLQRAVEAVMAQPLDEVMREQVFAPLGMTHSSYRWHPRIGERLLPGTKGNGVPRTVVPLLQPVAAFSLYITVDDYARFLIALLHDPVSLAEITDSPVDVDPRLNLSWGLGWGIEQSADGVHLWQWGNNPGYRAFVMVLPGPADALVLLSNGDGGLKLAEPLVRAHLPGEHKVFRSSFLTAGVLDTLCDVLRLCL